MTQFLEKLSTNIYTLYVAIGVAAQVVSALIAWHYLPPWLAHNPGVELLLLTFIVCDIAHFILHDK